MSISLLARRDKVSVHMSTLLPHGYLDQSAPWDEILLHRLVSLLEQEKPCNSLTLANLRFSEVTRINGLEKELPQGAFEDADTLIV